jgi:simple sugar transport system ATP-binding protein
VALRQCRLALGVQIGPVDERAAISSAPPSTRSCDPFSGFGSIEVRRQRAIADQTLHEQIGFRGAGIDADSTVGQLSGGEHQGIAIGGAMHFDADLIILDEPTVALAIKEVQRILDFVRRIEESGRACIYIEHNLAHVHELADTLVVLDRDPKGEMWLAELTPYLIDLQATHRGIAFFSAMNLTPWLGSEAFET